MSPLWQPHKDLSAIDSSEAIRKILDCLDLPSRPPVARAFTERDTNELEAIPLAFLAALAKKNHVVF